MAVPADDVATVRSWCTGRVPVQMRDRVRVECEVSDRHLTVVEVRSAWDGVGRHTREEVARLRWTQTRREWSLYARTGNLQWCRYDLLPPSSAVEPLLDEIDRDPTGIFWG